MGTAQRSTTPHSTARRTPKVTAQRITAQRGAHLEVEVACHDAAVTKVHRHARVDEGRVPAGSTRLAVGGWRWAAGGTGQRGHLSVNRASLPWLTFLPPFARPTCIGSPKTVHARGMPCTPPPAPGVPVPLVRHREGLVAREEQRSEVPRQLVRKGTYHGGHGGCAQGGRPQEQ